MIAKNESVNDVSAKCIAISFSPYLRTIYPNDSKSLETSRTLEMFLENSINHKLGVMDSTKIYPSSSFRIRTSEQCYPSSDIRTLQSMRELLVKFGGHRKVGIFRVSPKADEFEKTLREYSLGNITSTVCSNPHVIASCIKE